TLYRSSGWGDGIAERIGGQIGIAGGYDHAIIPIGEILEQIRAASIRDGARDPAVAAIAVEIGPQRHADSGDARLLHGARHSLAIAVVPDRVADHTGALRLLAEIFAEIGAGAVHTRNTAAPVAVEAGASLVRVAGLVRAGGELRVALVDHDNIVA